MYYGIVKVVFFWEGIRTGESEEKASKQVREPRTNSIHIWRRLRESNPISPHVNTFATTPSLLSLLIVAEKTRWLEVNLGSTHDQEKQVRRLARITEN